MMTMMMMMMMMMMMRIMMRIMKKMCVSHQMSKSGDVVTCQCPGSAEVISGLAFTAQPNTIHFDKVFTQFDLNSQVKFSSPRIKFVFNFMQI